VHGHLDVVPAATEDWTVHPFSGEVRDGVVWGRGAVDMKDFDAMLLSTVRARARAGVVPARPLVLCFTADEEAGGAKGAAYLTRHHRELLEDCTVAIGEVGGFSTTARGRRVYLVEAAERGMAWVRLTARGTAGHGSMRHPDNAVTRLAAAVARIGQHEWPVRLTPTMEVLLAAVADLAGTEATPANAESLIEEFGSAARMIGAGLRSSANPTMLDAGYKVNVVPGTATARVDGRFLPGYEDEFWATLATLVGPDVEVTRDVHLGGFETSYDGPVVDAMTAALLAEDPDAVVAPYLMSGGTDAKHWNKLGIRCFGFTPLRLPADLDFTALFHGVDERVPTDALEFGARVFDRFLDRA
jgi:acetylornithine deacetylase/succinyl-diaminopimelate desuccinylase-like protein